MPKIIMIGPKSYISFVRYCAHRLLVKKPGWTSQSSWPQSQRNILMKEGDFFIVQELVRLRFAEIELKFNTF